MNRARMLFPLSTPLLCTALSTGCAAGMLRADLAACLDEPGYAVDDFDSRCDVDDFVEVGPGGSYTQGFVAYADGRAFGGTYEVRTTLDIAPFPEPLVNALGTVELDGEPEVIEVGYSLPTQACGLGTLRLDIVRVDDEDVGSGAVAFLEVYQGGERLACVD